MKKLTFFAQVTMTEAKEKFEAAKSLGITSTFEEFLKSANLEVPMSSDKQKRGFEKIASFETFAELKASGLKIGSTANTWNEVGTFRLQAVKQKGFGMSKDEKTDLSTIEIISFEIIDGQNKGLFIQFNRTLSNELSAYLEKENTTKFTAKCEAFTGWTCSKAQFTTI